MRRGESGGDQKLRARGRQPLANRVHGGRSIGKGGGPVFAATGSATNRAQAPDSDSLVTHRAPDRWRQVVWTRRGLLSRAGGGPPHQRATAGVAAAMPCAARLRTHVSVARQRVALRGQAGCAVLRFSCGLPTLAWPGVISRPPRCCGSAPGCRGPAGAERPGQSPRPTGLRWCA